MNLASKLGEDIGGAGEIRMSEAAYEGVDSGHWKAEAVNSQCSGLACPHYLIQL